MTPERLAVIERLYHEALARPIGDRAAFIAAACAADESLRLEVESLLAHASVVGPLDIGAAAVAAALVSGTRPALEVGERIGAYRIIGRIGAGGMAEVYRARDTDLGRDVAIKVLPADVANDSVRLNRLEREARVLASLNHPNIAAIHGIEKPGRRCALVLELVDGETLAERLTRGPLSLAEAFEIARQLADALEAAHERGIVHRDLKPANIALTPAAVVKVLDFGLAKAGDAETRATPSVTDSGVIVGTAAYMSPEQARGFPVDKRADIWAFGCVVYEMLTARPAFVGKTVSDTLVSVLEREPAWDALPVVPPAVGRLLVRCLEKEPKRRLRDIRDIRLEMDDALHESPAGVPLVLPAGRLLSVRRLLVPGTIAGIAVLVIGFAVWALRSAAPPAAVVTRTVIALQPFDVRNSADRNGKTPAVRTARPAIALSPDGRTIVFQAQNESGSALYRRALDRLDAALIEGTQGAHTPFFSPDGLWLGFWVGGELKKVPVDGGPPTTVYRLPGPSGPAALVMGATWGEGDRIVYGAGFAHGGALWTVAAGGGSAQPVGKLDAGDYSHRLPHMLPEGKAVLFTIVRSIFKWDDAQVAVHSFVTGERKVLIEDAADARYLRSGHVAFVRRGTLMVAPFDLSRLEVTGPAVAVVEGLMQAANVPNANFDSGAGQFAISDEGALVYATGGIVPDLRQKLVWIDRRGATTPVGFSVNHYNTPRLAPDAQRVAVGTNELGALRIWVLDAVRHNMTLVTPPETRAMFNVWAPDGERIAFLLGGQPDDIYGRRTDGTGSIERLAGGEHPQMPASWTPDGRMLAYVEGHPVTSMDIWVVDVSVPGSPPIPVARTPALEAHPVFSPDGRWIAYSSNDSGRSEVYVQRYPGSGRRWTVSGVGGGSEPSWRGDGREIYYLIPQSPGLASGIAAASVRGDGEAFSVGASHTLFQTAFDTESPLRGYDVTRDGDRFLVRQRADPLPERTPELVLVQNWFLELKQLLSTSN